MHRRRARSIMLVHRCTKKERRIASGSAFFIPAGTA